MEKYKIQLDGSLGIILVEHPSLYVTFDKLMEIKELIENANNKKYNYGIYLYCPGYYFSYKLDTREIICCGTMNKQQCINETKEYINQRH